MCVYVICECVHVEIMCERVCVYVMYVYVFVFVMYVYIYVGLYRCMRVESYQKNAEVDTLQHEKGSEQTCECVRQREREREKEGGMKREK